MSPRTRHAPITSSPAACKSAQVARKSAQTNPAPTDKTARTNCRRARPNPPSAHSGNARANSQKLPRSTPGRSSPRHPCPNKLSHVTLKPEVRAASPTARAVPMRRNKPEAGLVQPAPERPTELRIAREAGYGLRCTEHTRTRPGHLAPQTARTKCEAAMDPQDLTQELRNEPERRRAHPFTAPSVSPRMIQRWEGNGLRPRSARPSAFGACRDSARKP